MSLYTGEKGIGITHNTLLDSPYVQQAAIRVAYPPIGAEELDTESGIHILTESGRQITTE